MEPVVSHTRIRPEQKYLLLCWQTDLYERPELEGGDVPGGDDGPVVPGQLVAAVSAHLGGPGVAVPDGQPVKPAAPGPACLQSELGEGEPDNLRTEISE